jgi:hypothetical protein
MMYNLYRPNPLFIVAKWLIVGWTVLVVFSIFILHPCDPVHRIYALASVVGEFKGCDTLLNCQIFDCLDYEVGYWNLREIANSCLVVLAITFSDFL